MSPRRMRRASGRGDKEGTGGKAFLSIGAGGEEGFRDEACVGARDEDRKTGQYPDALTVRRH